jgi:UDP-glucose 4-epimerase
MKNSEHILVTGGAGYIGSHTVLELLEAGKQVVVIDDLSTGSRELVPHNVIFVEGAISDRKLVCKTIKQYACSTVLHFAGSIVVPESISNPLKYYRNNVTASLELIEACVAEGITEFIFSSTAAVYGMPEELPVGEDAPLKPINPYGTSKMMIEGVLQDVAAATGLRYAILRYFNVAGADPGGRSGQTIPKATHLLKVACEAALGKRDVIEIYGEDYATSDGTCIRDYIHVSDLAAAHVATLDKLKKSSSNLILNCGYGHGVTVRQIIDKVSEISGVTLNVKGAARRPGDPMEIFANTQSIEGTLNWTPKYDNLDDIVSTALEWERRL